MNPFLKVKTSLTFKGIFFIFQVNFLWKFTKAFSSSETPVNEWLRLLKQRCRQYR